MVNQFYINIQNKDTNQRFIYK